MSEGVSVFGSLRLRLIFGAALIALVAVLAAALAAYGTATTAQMIERSVAAQARIDLLSGLSARVRDYAVVAVETASPEVPTEARQARLNSLATRVNVAFSSIDKALASAVAVAESDGETEQMRLATRSLGFARMRAQFEALHRSITSADGGPRLRAYLDGFATQFSPPLNEAIAEEQRDRDAARSAVADMRDRMIWRALFAATVAALLTLTFYLFLVHPLVEKLTRIREAATGIGAGNFGIVLPANGTSEIDWLMHEINETSNRLRDRQTGVDEDRAHLNQIISERTSRLEEANKRLALIDVERRRFFADIGHELRTPLTVILAESELGLKARDDAEDAAESLSVIHARARRLNRRIDDLLRVARSETGQVELDCGQFDLSNAAADAVADMEPLAKRRNLQLVSTLSATPAVGDRDWCRQIVGGLIENAMKKSPAGSTIEIFCAPRDGLAYLTVTDEGEGLENDDIDKVFSRFVRGSRESSGSGFGVGLALARWVIEKQSGSIDLVSPAPRSTAREANQGIGAQVTITLPIADNARAIAATDQDRRPHLG